MGVTLPYEFQDGQRAYAARVMADLLALADGFNNVSVSGFASGDLNDVLDRLKALTDSKITASQVGNADQIRFSDGCTIQEKIENGDLNGADGVVSTSDGMYYFYVGDDGHLYLVTRSQVEGAAFAINNEGHLIYTVDDPGPAVGEPKVFDLGNVRGPQGKSGDMEVSIYDPTGKQQDVFAYADQAAAAAHGSSTKSCYAYAAGWDSSTKRNTVLLNGLTAADNFYVCHSNNASTEQRRAWRNGQIFLASQSNGQFVLQADGTVPTMDIPLVVIILP